MANVALIPTADKQPSTTVIEHVMRTRGIGSILALDQDCCDADMRPRRYNRRVPKPIAPNGRRGDDTDE
jgi:hypothetical protein